MQTKIQKNQKKSKKIKFFVFLNKIALMGPEYSRDKNLVQAGITAMKLCRKGFG